MDSSGVEREVHEFRGAIIESVMLDVMYEVPSIEDLAEVIIDESVVKGEGTPEYVAEIGGSELA